MPCIGFSPPEKVIFVGLGQMGRALAPHLVGPDLGVTCVDPDEEARRKARESGLTCVTELREVDAADAVFACVPGPVELGELVEELHAFQAPPRFFVNLSTIGPAAAVEVCARFRSASPDGAYVESPISGGVLRAAKRECALLWAAEPAESRSSIEPLLGRLSKRIIWFEAIAEASTAKLANNLAMLAASLGTLEAIAWGTRRGVELGDLFDALGAGTADSYPLRSTLARSVRGGDYERGFAMRLALKDVRLILDAADDEGIEMPFAREIEQQLSEGCDAGLADLTFPAVAVERNIRGASPLSGVAGETLRNEGGAVR